MRRAVAFAINLYQHTLSPDHGWLRARHPYGACRFYPTCSEYTKQAVLQRGTLAGLWLGVRRVLRCHPWSTGGIDHVPRTQ